MGKKRLRAAALPPLDNIDMVAAGVIAKKTTESTKSGYKQKMKMIREWYEQHHAGIPFTYHCITLSLKRCN